jgi:hypothetical protein
MATITGFKADQEGAYAVKDPNAKLSYTIDWSEWLPTSTTISASTWTLETISGDAAPIVNFAAVNTTTTATITITGGTTNNVYTVTNQITTSAGLIDRRYFRLQIKARSL